MTSELVDQLKQLLPDGFLLVYPSNEDPRFNLGVAMHKCDNPLLREAEDAIYSHLGVKPVNPNMVKAAHKAWKTIRAKKAKHVEAGKKAWKTIRTKKAKESEDAFEKFDREVYAKMEHCSHG